MASNDTGKSTSAADVKQQLEALEQREEKLSLKTAAQEATQNRIETHQQQVAETERANQLKAQDLIQRELRLSENERLLNRERKLLRETMTLRKTTRQKRSALVLPVLLVVCVIGGYLAFDNLNKQQQYFRQVQTASENIDKLAKVLNLTQERMLQAKSALTKKEVELNNTRKTLAMVLDKTQNLPTVSRNEATWLDALLARNAEASATNTVTNALPISVYKPTPVSEIISSNGSKAITPLDKQALQTIKQNLRNNALQLADSIDALAERETLITELQQTVETLSQELGQLRLEHIQLQTASQSTAP
jgi:DNA repair exonuclease SbcCD ATPase subunit